MRKLILLITTLLTIPAALADGWDMMGGYGMMGWGVGSFIGLVYFAIFSFVFSAIFWWTYKWLAKEKKK